MAALRRATSEGYLTLLEFEERLDTAFSARYLDELDRLLADLPGARRQSARPAPGPARPQRGPWWPAGLPRQIVRSALAVLAVLLAVAIVANFWVPMLIFGLIWMKRGRGRCGWSSGRCGWSGRHHHLDYL